MTFLTGVGECEIDPSYINPLILRPESGSTTDTLTGPEVEGELETTDYPGPDEVPGSTAVHGGSSGTTVKVTKTTTVKKVTSTVTKKKTSKTSEKDYSVSTDRTTSSGGYSYSSSSSSSSSSSLDRGIYTDDEEGSGFDHDTGREHGRSQSRVSRRVSLSSRGNTFGVDNQEGDENEGDDGSVISHHEETRVSSGTSPDGKTRFRETHHERKKVTVKEEATEDEVPRRRWGVSGGHRRTSTDTSSGTRTSGHDPGDSHHWEEGRTSHSDRREHYGTEHRSGFGEDGGSSTYGVDDESQYGRRGQSGTHTTESGDRGESFTRTHSQT